jgi:hypothetical protein
VSQEFLKRISCPAALVLANDRDTFWPEGLEELHASLMKARVFRMSGGHHLHMTNVDGVMDAIKEVYQSGGFLKLKSKL